MGCREIYSLANPLGKKRQTRRIGRTDIQSRALIRRTEFEVLYYSKVILLLHQSPLFRPHITIIIKITIREYYYYYYYCYYY